MPALSRPDLIILAGAPVAMPSAEPPHGLLWRVDGAAVEIYLVTAERRRFLGLLEPGAYFTAFATDSRALHFVASQTARLVNIASGTSAGLTDAIIDSLTLWVAQASAVAGIDQPDVPVDWLSIPRFSATFMASLESAFAAQDASRDALLMDQLGTAAMAAPHDAVYDALRAAADYLMGHGNSRALPSHSQSDGIGDFGQTALLARRWGLRATRVILPMGWSADDCGPLLLQASGADDVVFAHWRRPAFGARSAASSYVDSDGRPIADSDYGSMAFRLYAPMRDDVSRLTGMAKNVLRGIASEWPSIAASAMGVALLGLILPVVAGWIFDTIVPGGERGLLVAAGLALVGSAVIIALLSAIRSLTISRVRGRGMIAMMAGISDHVLRLPARFFRTTSAGDFVQRLSGIESARSLVTDIILSAGLTALFALLYLGQLFVFDVRLALTALALTLIYGGVTVFVRMVQTAPLTLAAERDGALSTLTYELLEGIAKLRSADAEERMLARWRSAYALERDAAAAADRIEAHFGAFADSWNLLTLAGLFATAALLTMAHLTVGQFIAFLSAFALFQAAFAQLSDALLGLWGIQPVVDRARMILAAEPEARAGRSDPGPLSGHITVSGLSFAYDGGQGPVLHGLDFEVRPGEHLAIVGGSGSGKSTILRLLLGFEAPLTGSITYDGQDLSHLDPARVRAQIGVVMQSSQLFAGSIRDNIRGATDASLKDCMAAAEAVGLASDLRDFAMGMHTPITEGAGTLSGGQRQRILIARALAGRPNLLFLDEATSALDNKTQAVVAATMDAMCITRITIAHRLSTVRNADRIAVLEHGRIVETGDFATLIASGGRFAALAQRQLLEE